MLRINPESKNVVVETSPMSKWSDVQRQPFTLDLHAVPADDLNRVLRWNSMELDHHIAVEELEKTLGKQRYMWDLETMLRVLTAAGHNTESINKAKQNKSKSQKNNKRSIGRDGHHFGSSDLISGTNERDALRILANGGLAKESLGQGNAWSITPLGSSFLVTGRVLTSAGRVLAVRTDQDTADMSMHENLMFLKDAGFSAEVVRKVTATRVSPLLCDHKSEYD